MSRNPSTTTNLLREWIAIAFFYFTMDVTEVAARGPNERLSTNLTRGLWDKLKRTDSIQAIKMHLAVPVPFMLLFAFWDRAYWRSVIGNYRFVKGPATVPPLMAYSAKCLKIFWRIVSPVFVFMMNMEPPLCPAVLTSVFSELSGYFVRFPSFHGPLLPPMAGGV